jgi:D-arabinose 1-dehydrogenase
VLSYAHSNLANNTFPLYVPSLLNPSSTSPSGISNELPSIHKMHLLTASPLSMGLLVPGGVPAWHPVRVDARNEGLVEATRQVGELVEREWKEEGGMVDLALGFGLRNPTYILDPASGEKVRVPVMVGAKNVEEVRAAVRVWNEVNVDDGGEERRKKLERRKRVEEMVRRVYVEAGWEDVSWASPQSGAVGL